MGAAPRGSDLYLWLIWVVLLDSQACPPPFLEVNTGTTTRQAQSGDIGMFPGTQKGAEPSAVLPSPLGPPLTLAATVLFSSRAQGSWASLGSMVQM